METTLDVLAAKTREHRIDLRRWARCIDGIVAAITAIVLVIGWFGHVDLMTRLHAGLPAMVPVTALSLLTLAVAMLLYLRDESWSRNGCVLISAIVLVATLGRLLADLEGGAPVSPGADRMSVATALGIVLVAVAQISCAIGGSSGLRLAVAISTLGLVLSFLALAGYLFDLQSLNKVSVFTGLALHTTICLGLLFLAVLFAAPEESWLGTLFESGPGSAGAWNLLPLAVIGPIFVSFLALRSTEVGLLDPSVRLSALSVAFSVLAVFLVVRNARYQNRNALRAQAEEWRMKLVLDGLDTAVFVLNEAGAVRLMNRRAEDIHAGAESPEGWLYDTRFHSLRDRRPLRGERRPVQRLIRSGGTEEVFAGWLGPDGGEHALRFSLEQMSEVGLRVISVQDETESWIMRENLSRTEKLDAVGQLAGGISHELSNILGAVRLSADTGLLGDNLETAQRHLRAVQAACDRGSDLARRLLNLSREPEEQAEVVDLSAIVTENMQLVRSSVPASIHVEARVPEGPVLVNCSPTDLESALLNLIINARNALTESETVNARIELAVTISDDRAHLAVIDNGPGIRPQLLPRVREPFFTTRRDKGGSGLGLAMVETMARRIGGHFVIESALGEGTTASLFLPVADASETTVKEGAQGHVDLTGLDILVVEDDPQFQAIVTEALVCLGAAVDKVDTAEAALQRLARAPEFDLLLTDIMLSGPMDGYALAEEAVKLCPNLRVTYMSAYTDQLSRSGRTVPGLRLRKPVGLAELSNALSLATGRR